MTFHTRDEDPFEDFCPNCGQYIGGDSICPNCGTEIFNEDGLDEVNDDEDEGGGGSSKDDDL